MIPLPPPWVWFGGLRCEQNQLKHWLSSESFTEETVATFRADITEEAVESFEASSGLSASTDLVEFAREFWEPYVDPIARAQWQELLGPAVSWFSERVRCTAAWRLGHGRDPELLAELGGPFWVFLDEQRGSEPFRAQIGAVIDENAPAFAPLALEVLPR